MKVLMDTGPWVAFIDRSETKHKDCIQWLKGFKGEIFSTEAVLTEVLYLLNFSSQAQSAALDFVLTGAVKLVPSFMESLKKIQSLIQKYKDFPMDFADATLVVLANNLGIEHIMTFDKKHFRIYRIGQKGNFVIVL